MKYGAVIVAAGMSTRMKQLKQLMRIGDLSMAERVIVNFRRAGVEEIVMVTGCDAEQVEKALRAFSLTFIRNRDYASTQMFDSASMGLSYIRGKCDRVFFCPVDVPFFTDQTLNEQIRMMDECGGTAVVIPSCGGRDGHPLLLDGGVIGDILSYSGSRGMRGAYESLPQDRVRRIEVGDQGAVTDADTEEDYRKLVDIHNSRILHTDVRIRFISTTPFFGPGTVELLKQITICKNVREACENCGFSYSKGWMLIKNCEEKFGFRIVERQPGGMTGGTAKVTERGTALLEVYKALEEEIGAFTEKRFRQLMEKQGLMSRETERTETV